MSTISAGTTLTTALVQTGDTTGQLVLQTNGTTTAVTIGTDQAVTFAGNVSVTGTLSTTAGIPSPLAVKGNSTAGAELRLPEDTDNGSNYVALKAADNIASNITFTLPSADGTNGQVLQTNGSGTLSFATPGGGSWTYLSTVTASNSATADIETIFDSTYDQYVIIATGVRASSSVQLYCRLKIGGSYQSANYAFRANTTTQTSDNGYLPQTDGNASEINLGRALEGTSTSSNLTFYMHIPNPSSTAFVKGVYWRGILVDGSASYYFADYSGYATCRVSTSALTGVRFLLSSGNITAGTFRLYGIKNS